MSARQASEGKSAACGPPDGPEARAQAPQHRVEHAVCRDPLAAARAAGIWLALRHEEDHGLLLYIDKISGACSAATAGTASARQAADQHGGHAQRAHRRHRLAIVPIDSASPSSEPQRPRRLVRQRDIRRPRVSMASPAAASSKKATGTREPVLDPNVVVAEHGLVPGRRQHQKASLRVVTAIDAGRSKMRPRGCMRPANSPGRPQVNRMRIVRYTFGEVQVASTTNLTCAKRPRRSPRPSSTGSRGIRAGRCRSVRSRSGLR